MTLLNRIASAALLLAFAPAGLAAAPEAITPADPGSVQRGIESAAKAGAKRVVIPAGIYRLVPPPGSGAHLPLANLADLEIDARGVTFVMTEQAHQGIWLYRCRNVTLRGCTLVHTVPPFTQGRIERISDDRKSVDVRIARGYPALDGPGYPANPTGYVFDRTARQWKRGAGDYYVPRFERLEARLYRLQIGGPVDRFVEVGDPMAFRGPGGQDIYLGECQGMRIRDVTIRSGSGFCVHEDGGDGGNFYTYTVTYGPKPEGADEAPLIASNADAFHSSGVRHGPTLVNCHFEGMPDDGVPIHGAYSLVARAEGDRLVVTDDRFRVGDPLRLVAQDGGYLAEATVRAARAMPDFRPVGKSVHHPFENLAGRKFTELTLDRALPDAGFDCLVSNPNAIGSGFVVRGCVIRNHRARGMLLKADNGLVENNVVDGSTIDGIVVSPELWWGEACYSRNVVIRNNTVRNCGYAMVGPWTGQAGAITVMGEGKVRETPGNQHIVIENNTIEGCNGTNLLLDSCLDVAVRNNRFVRAQTEPSVRGAERFDPTALVYITQCQGVRLAGNTVPGPRSYGKALVEVTPSASGVTGVEGGVKTR